MPNTSNLTVDDTDKQKVLRLVGENPWPFRSGEGHLGVKVRCILRGSLFILVLYSLVGERRRK